LSTKLDAKVSSPHLNFNSLTRVLISRQLGLDYFDGVTVTLSLASEWKLSGNTHTTPWRLSKNS